MYMYNTYKYKNEVGYRDDTVPKTGTAKRSESMQPSSATPKNLKVGIGLRKIVACSHSSLQCLLVPTVLGSVIPTSYFIFILVSRIFLSRLSLDCRMILPIYIYIYQYVPTFSVHPYTIKTEVVTCTFNQDKMASV